MRDERLNELLWERIDGTIADEDRQRLADHLEDHPEARQREQELLAVAEALEHVEDVDTPAELRRRIDSAIADSGDPARGVVSGRVTLSEYRYRGWRVRYMYLAAGLVIGVVAASLVLVDRPTDSARVSGTMGVHRPQPVDVVRTFDLEGSRGRLVLGTEADSLVADLHLEAGDEAEVMVSAEAWQPRILAFEGAESGSSRVRVEGDSIVFVVTGPTRCVLTAGLPDQEQRIAIRVVVAGEELIHERVALDGDAREDRDPTNF